jgi:hypothetical protein
MERRHSTCRTDPQPRLLSEFNAPFCGPTLLLLLLLLLLL